MGFINAREVYNTGGLSTHTFSPLADNGFISLPNGRFLLAEKGDDNTLYIRKSDNGGITWELMCYMKGLVKQELVEFTMSTFEDKLFIAFITYDGVDVFKKDINFVNLNYDEVILGSDVSDKVTVINDSSDYNGGTNVISMTVNPINGEVFIAFSYSDSTTTSIYNAVLRSTDYINWEEGNIFSNPATTSTNNLNIISNKYGDVMAFLYHKATYTFVRPYLLNSDGTWTAQTDISPNNQRSTNFEFSVATFGRNFYVAYNYMYSSTDFINVYVTENLGTSWKSKAISLTDANDKGSPKIEVDRDGNVFVVWKEVSGSYTNINGRVYDKALVELYPITVNIPNLSTPYSDINLQVLKSPNKQFKYGMFIPLAYSTGNRIIVNGEFFSSSINLLKTSFPNLQWNILNPFNEGLNKITLNLKGNQVSFNDLQPTMSYDLDYNVVKFPINYGELRLYNNNNDLIQVVPITVLNPYTKMLPIIKNYVNENGDVLKRAPSTTLQNGDLVYKCKDGRVIFKYIEAGKSVIAITTDFETYTPLMEYSSSYRQITFTEVKNKIYVFFNLSGKLRYDIFDSKTLTREVVARDDLGDAGNSFLVTYFEDIDLLCVAQSYTVENGTLSNIKVKRGDYAWVSSSPSSYHLPKLFRTDTNEICGVCVDTASNQFLIQYYNVQEVELPALTVKESVYVPCSPATKLYNDLFWDCFIDDECLIHFTYCGVVNNIRKIIYKKPLSKESWDEGIILTDTIMPSNENIDPYNNWLKASMNRYGEVTILATSIYRNNKLGWGALSDYLTIMFKFDKDSPSEFLFTQAYNSVSNMTPYITKDYDGTKPLQAGLSPITLINNATDDVFYLVQCDPKLSIQTLESIYPLLKFRASSKDTLNTIEVYLNDELIQTLTEDLTLDKVLDFTDLVESKNNLRIKLNSTKGFWEIKDYQINEEYGLHRVLKSDLRYEFTPTNGTLNEVIAWIKNQAECRPNNFTSIIEEV